MEIATLTILTTALLAVIGLLGTALFQLRTEVSQLRRDISELRAEVAALSAKFDAHLEWHQQQAGAT